MGRVLAFVLAATFALAANAAPRLSAVPRITIGAAGSSRAATAVPASNAMARAGNAKVPALLSRGGGILSAYGAFASKRPFENGVLIALLKTAAADVLAQSATAGPHDWARTALFGVFGAAYLGVFQYAYQVQVFRRLFKSTDRFTSQPWAAKAKDVAGLVSLGFQIALDMAVLSFVYLPAFYIFKAAAFSATCAGPLSCAHAGYAQYQAGFATDLPALLKCWIPADLVCFSIALHLRLPIRHIWSFFWTVYLSYFRGART